MLTDDLATLRLAFDDGILTIEINRPERLNALTIETADDLRTALDRAEAPEVRAVVITGAGRSFSSGADLRAPFGEPLPSGAPDFEMALTQHFNWPVRQIRQLRKPVIAAVNGPAVGVAVSYALACDQVVAASSAYFLLSFVNVGLVPDGGASALIPARVGAGRFARLALRAERLTAAEALEWGMVDDVVDDAELHGSAMALARRFADGATEALAHVKRLVNDGPLRHLEEALQLEAELQGTRGDAAEFQEGVAAFLEKRPPRFAELAPS